MMSETSDMMVAAIGRKMHAKRPALPMMAVLCRLR